jgi:hypothetical protein
MLMLILTLAIIGFVVYLITTYIPMPPIFKTGILVIVAVIVILYLMQVLGVADLPVPRVR